MSAGEVHVGDVGTVFTFTIKQAGVVIPVSSATTKEVMFKKPDGSKMTRTAEFVNGGAEGQVKYVTVAGDLDQSGDWQIQAYLVMPGRENYSDISTLVVFPNL